MLCKEHQRLTNEASYRHAQLCVGTFTSPLDFSFCEVSLMETSTTPLLQLEAQDDKTCMYHRVVWCPYWPDDGEEADGVLQDSSKVLAYTQGEKVGFSTWAKQSITALVA